MQSSLRPYGIALCLLVAACFFLYLVRAIAVPFLIALFLAYLLDPAVGALERRGLSRGIAVCAVFGVFLLLSAGGLAFLLPALKKEIVHLHAALPRYAESLYKLVPDGLLTAVGIENRDDLQGIFLRIVEGAKALSFDVVNQVAQFLSRAFSSTFSFLLSVLGYFIIPVYLFYLLRDFVCIREGLFDLVPLRHRPAVKTLATEIDGVLSGFLRGQLTVCLILGALYSLGLFLIGVDLALVVGLLSGLAFIIPYVGTLLGMATGSALAAVEFRDLLHPALVVGWFALVQALEGTVITPKIVGDRVGLNPLATILAILIGGELFGFFGLLLAVPAAASGKVVLAALLRRYRRSSLYLAPEEREDRA